MEETRPGPGTGAETATQRSSLEQSTQPQTPIGQEVMAALNLTQEQVIEYDKAKVEEKRRLEELPQKGSEYYDELKDKYGTTTYIRGLLKIKEVNLQPRVGKPEEIPDNVINLVEKHSEPQDLPSVLERTRAFFDGYGHRAIENGDWNTAIAALDVSSENGILANENALSRINVLVKDPTQKIEIGKLIQKRVDRRKTSQADSASTPEANPIAIQTENPGPSATEEDVLQPQSPLDASDTPTIDNPTLRPVPSPGQPPQT